MAINKDDLCINLWQTTTLLSFSCYFSDLLFEYWLCANLRDYQLAWPLEGAAVKLAWDSLYVPSQHCSYGQVCFIHFTGILYKRFTQLTRISICMNVPITSSAVLLQNTPAINWCQWDGGDWKSWRLAYDSCRCSLKELEFHVVFVLSLGVIWVYFWILWEVNLSWG